MIDIVKNYGIHLKKSQIYYYGQLITKGKNTPDIHGTLLLIWALSMIFELNDIDSFKLKILKP